MKQTLTQMSEAVAHSLGLEAEGNAKVADGLSRFLASTYTLYLQTLIHHWNVNGPNFAGLHAMLGDQYKNLQSAGDVIAERIRAIGHPAPGAVEELIDHNSFPIPEERMGWEEMVGELCDANERCSREARMVLEAAEESEDYVTVDLMTERMAWHDKAAWMLRSMLI